jgi:hypothetical protein
VVPPPNWPDQQRQQLPNAPLLPSSFLPFFFLAHQSRGRVVCFLVVVVLTARLSRGLVYLRRSASPAAFSFFLSFFFLVSLGFLRPRGAMADACAIDPPSVPRSLAALGF